MLTHDRQERRIDVHEYQTGERNLLGDVGRADAGEPGWGRGIRRPLQPGIAPDVACSVSDYPLFNGPGSGGNNNFAALAAAGSSSARRDDDDDDDKPKKPKKLQCKNGFVVVNGVKTPCEVVTGEALTDGGGLIDELPPVEKRMTCKANGTCTATLPPILPTGLFCDSTGTPAIDFTADPPFVVNTKVKRTRQCTAADVTSGQCGSTSETTFEYAQAWFGCYAKTANSYTCENIPDYPFLGCTGEVTGTDYCDIPPLTGTAICGVSD